MPQELQQLIDAAKVRVFSPAEREAQRRSFAYGNVAFNNQLVTRSMIDQVADRMVIHSSEEKK